MKAKVQKSRSDWIQTFSFESLLDAVILEMIHEVCFEAYNEGIKTLTLYIYIYQTYQYYHETGRNAKLFSERRSGIFFPNEPAWMQYDTYTSLAKVWQDRKLELKRKIEINKGQSAKILAVALKKLAKIKERKAMSLEEIQRRRQERKLRKLELDRQQKICEEMRKEEIRMREFMRWELKENLRERRLMVINIIDYSQLNHYQLLVLHTIK